MARPKGVIDCLGSITLCSSNPPLIIITKKTSPKPVKKKMAEWRKRDEKINGINN